jgi:hypothetical protein|tara:strand:+ start:1408 stop:1719 length:312 start_codon:yes stop_codon:yes gene_type:complete
MIGNLEPEEHVMDESVKFPSSVLNKIAVALEALGWDYNDEIAVEIGGTAVSGIHQGKDYNKKWATPFGVRKYNKDAFIVIKNLDRSPFEPSKANPDLKAHHAE